MWIWGTSKEGSLTAVFWLELSSSCWTVWVEVEHQNQSPVLLKMNLFIKLTAMPAQIGSTIANIYTNRENNIKIFSFVSI
jgi:hypothetical protein